MSRRQIQQLRDDGASRHGNHDAAERADSGYDDDDDDAPTNNTALRMSARHIRSLDDVIDSCQLLRSKLKVGLISVDQDPV